MKLTRDMGYQPIRTAHCYRTALFFIALRMGW